MNIIYTTKNKCSSFTESMKDDFLSHFKRLSRYLSEEPIKVSLEQEGNEFTLKVQVVTKQNKRLRCEEHGEDYYDLVTKARDSIEKQIIKSKEKLTWKERITKPVIEVEEPEELIVKTKEFLLDDINVNMAINEMEKLGHEWFVFRNIDNDSAISIVYKRMDDNYSMIVLK